MTVTGKYIATLNYLLVIDRVEHTPIPDREDELRWTFFVRVQAMVHGVPQEFRRTVTFIERGLTPRRAKDLLCADAENVLTTKFLAGEVNKMQGTTIEGTCGLGS